MRSHLLLFAVLLVVYVYGLGSTAMVGPDEPRYAAIGREMARSGDWVAPVLWGKPWFEKPPLLYWMTAVATVAGLGPDWAPRLPVALLGWAFVVFLWWIAREPFGDRAALYASAILGTSVGWLAYTFVAVTDAPLAATFCAAMLIALYRPGPKWACAAGACLGLAVLAKGLVPLVLFAPVVWLLRRRWRDVVLIGVVCVVVAGPWYAAMTVRFGSAFLDDFIWKQHFQRFSSDVLAHVRPWWFFIPVLLGAVLPWTPVLALLRRDPRLSFLIGWLAYGFVFFSASRNKLPGYVLPLVPVVALIAGVALARRGPPLPYGRGSLYAAAVLGGVGAVVAPMLPEALRHGVSHAWFVLSWAALAIGFVLCACGVIAARRSPVALAVVFAVGVLAAKIGIVPRLSPRSGETNPICIPVNSDRDAMYRLNYYAGRELPRCPE